MKHHAQILEDYSPKGARIIPLRPSASPHRPLETVLACPTSDGLHLVRINEITHCVADGNYVRVCYGGGKELLLSKTLGAIAGKLPETHFVRVHQSHLVNLAMITCLRSDAVVLTNGVSIPVSRRARVQLKSIIQSFSL